MFDAIGDREGVRHKSFFPLCQPSFQQGSERPDDVDKSRWTAKLEEYGQQTLTTDCIKSLGQVHKEDVQVLILLAYISWFFTSYGEDYVDCPSVSLEAAMLTLGDDIMQLVVVGYGSV